MGEAGATFFSTPPLIAAGRGAFGELGRMAKVLGARALLVSGEGSLERQGILARAEGLLEEAGLEQDVFRGVPPEAPLPWVVRALEAARDFRAEVVIGLGGGSVLDVAKAAAGLLKEPHPVARYFEGMALSGTGVPFVAVPTTFGTGSEATPNAVLWDPEARVKQSIRHPSLLSRAVIVDPALGEGAPPAVKAEAGMDAFVQAVESYFSRHATPLTEALSQGAVSLVAGGLVAFVRGRDAHGAAESCALGSLMAGMALANARLGLVHGLAHPIGARTGIRHGRLCAILLPYALRYNRETVLEKYAILTHVLKEDPEDFSLGLLTSLNLPTDLAEANLAEEDIGPIVAEAMPSGSLQANPRLVTEEELAALLREACRL
ncbi:MAG: iron-containing alcohol dehydrogenase [Planctomycetota bacterium]